MARMRPRHERRRRPAEGVGTTHSLSSSYWTGCFIKHPDLFNEMYRAAFEVSPRNQVK